MSEPARGAVAEHGGEMIDAIDDLITKVMKREGGYVDNPDDRGGPTKYGITRDTLAASRGHSVSSDDVANLGEGEARTIYRRNYFVGLDDVTSPKVLELLFDYSVHSGPARAVSALQEVIGTKPDGNFGPNSKAALAKIDQATLYWPLVCERLDNFLRIIGKDWYHGDKTQGQFAEGWANRIVPFWKGVGDEQDARHPNTAKP